jgi:two-component system, response regulator PdtaR
VFETASSTGWDTGAGVSAQAYDRRLPTTLAGVLRVVVAEDEAVIRMDLVEMLAEDGFEVVSAVSDGEAAVEAILRLRPDVSLIDVAMPRLDGLEVARQVSGVSAVVLITAFGQREIVAQATEAGAMGYLVKPVARAALMPAIEVASARWLTADRLQSEVSDLSERLTDRKDVDRAKGLLMAAGMSESEAFTALRQQAMDGRITLGAAARAVIAAIADPRM